MSAFNLLLENIDPLSQLLLQALFKTLWQGLLIVALVWLLLRVFRQTSATTRHAVWLASLLILCALPFIAIATKRDVQSQSPTVESHKQAVKPQPAISFPPVTVQPNNALGNPSGKLSEKLPNNFADQRTAAASVKTTLPRLPNLFADADRAAQIDQSSRFITLAESAKVAPAINLSSASSAPIAKNTFWQRLTTWFANSRYAVALPVIFIAAWLMVCALMLGRIVHSYHALFRLRQKLDAASGEQQDRVQYLSDLFGIHRRVTLFTSARVTTPLLIPMTVGAFKPIIVLPPELANSFSQSEFDSVVAHELAHIKRWDYLTNLLQRMAQAFLFFHPAVWFIGRQLMIERELACDDWAVKMCEPRRYASCLTRLVEILSDSRPLAAAAGILFGKHVISRRVEMILNRDRNATTAVSKPAVVYAIGLALTLVVVCSLLSPVIAIPLGQQAKKQKKETKATTPTPSSSQMIPLPPLPPDAPPALAELTDFADAPLPPLPPDAPEIAALEEAMISIQDPPTPPVAPVAPIAPIAPVPAIASSGGAGIGSGSGFGSGSSFGLTAASPAIGAVNLQDAWATPYATTIASWGQDDKNKTPAIPEAELLSLLTDIVKRDSDPNVRQEALQGIYRMRSDAAINTLIQLYDSVSDPKNKGEIIGYMLRRTGDNAKAISKLTQIAKAEGNEELRNRAIRYLGNVKGDEGATNLISIYDGVQDAKAKQYIVRSLAYNKSGKAIEKLKQIAKNDADPQIRSAAIRSLYGIDNRLYLDTIPPGAKIGTTDGQWSLKELNNLRSEADALREEAVRFNQNFKLKEFEKMKKNLKLDNSNYEMLLKDGQLQNAEEMKRLIEEKRRRIEESRPETPRARPQKESAPTPQPKPGQSVSIVSTAPARAN